MVDFVRSDEYTIHELCIQVLPELVLYNEHKHNELKTFELVPNTTSQQREHESLFFIGGEVNIRQEECCFSLHTHVHTNRTFRPQQTLLKGHELPIVWLCPMTKSKMVSS